MIRYGHPKARQRAVIESIRDIFIIIYLALGIVVALVILVATWLMSRAVLRSLRSVRRAAEDLQTFTGTMVEKVGKPLSASSSIASVIGAVLGFITGLGRRRRKKND